MTTPGAAVPAAVHVLRIAALRHEANQCAVITFDVPEELRRRLHYRQGQYITLALDIAGRSYRRPYSLCSSAAVDRDLQIAVKRIPGGTVSNYLHDQVETGDSIAVLGPAGNFHTDIDPAQAKRYVLFAAGAGITPMMSIAKTVLHTEPRSRVLLLYGNRNRESILFRKELAQLARTFAPRFEQIHFLSQQRPTLASRLRSLLPGGGTEVRGRMTPPAIDALLRRCLGPGELERCENFVCGPGVMMREVIGYLGTKVSAARIHHEYFIGSNNGVDGPAQGCEAQDPPEALRDRDVSVMLNGCASHVHVMASQSILEGAERAGLNPPYSCRSAVCSSCVARLVSGRISMTMNAVLTADDVARGKILTCQAHPLTDDVVVNYDAACT